MEHWLFFTPVSVVVFRGLYVLCRRWVVGYRASITSADRLAALFALIECGYLLFLLVCYLGAFRKGEARIAAEFFRYQSHLGGAGLIAVFALAMERLPQPLPVLTAPAVLAVQLVIAAFILPAPGVYFEKAAYGPAELQQVRHIGKTAGQAITQAGKPVDVQFILNDDLLSITIVQFDIWATAPLLVRAVGKVWVSPDELPTRFATALRLEAHAVAIERQGNIHCAVHGGAANVDLMVSASETLVCTPLLIRIQNVIYSARNITNDR
jgi:hypothetical protein